MPEESVLRDLSADNVRRHVEHIVREIPTRLAGSDNARRMAEYSCDALRQAGAAAEMHTLPGLVSFPDVAECRLLTPMETAIQANTLGHSLATLADGISGELVYVGSGAFGDYQGKDVTGKIILTELSYSPARHEKQRIAGLKGAIGAVMMNWGHAENSAVPFGSVKPVWGNPTPETYKNEMPTIACIGIARTAGLRLKELCISGRQPRIWFRTHVENGWRPVQITVGEVKAPKGDDFVLVGGHQDSWFGEAATDNAAGNACAIELARVFQMHRQELRRGLVFGFWTGHETGTMIGSSWFVDRNWDRLRRHLVAYLQIDQPACAGTTRWSAASNGELRRFHQAVERRVLGNRASVWHRAAKSGDSSFFGLGAPMMHAEGGFTDEELAASALATLGWWHHSIENRLDKLDWAWMADHLRVYGAYLWQLATDPVLPFEFVGVADQFIERLVALLPAGRAIGLEGALGRAREFREAASRLDNAVTSWRERYRTQPDADETAAKRLNECMKRLSRLLVPMQSTVKGTYGQDPYGLTAQTTMIPCLYDVPGLADLADGEARWMLETQLVRERNRVADALGDACGVIDDTLRQVG
ncbi:MAG: M28 family peptidase [Alphaproteobacteria bacterium]|nr:M28 family peptidase [Alphaproteobacteria bacterium]